MIPSRIMQPPVQPMPELQHSDKFMEEEDATIVRKPPVIKGDPEVFWRSSHSAFHLTKC